MTRKINIFDTTLRDGEQSPGASMNTEEKLIIARQLIRMNVDVIEAGFPISSPGDFKSVAEIGRIAGDKCTVCGLTRAVDKDIEVAAEALKTAKRPRIHTGLGVSPSHLRDKLHLTEDEAIERAVHAVKLARSFVDDVEFYTYAFYNMNGFVEDPVKAHNDYRKRLVWTDTEKQIFLDKYRLHPREFRKIAAGLPNKSVKDCIEFYYVHRIDMKLKELEQMTKKRGRKKMLAEGAVRK